MKITDKDVCLDYISEFSVYYYASVNKWNNIGECLYDSLLNNTDIQNIEIGGSCGFCYKYKRKNCFDFIPYIRLIAENNTCSACPLFKNKICSSFRKDDVLFWKINKAFKENNKGLARVLCAKMISEIRKYPF